MLMISADGEDEVNDSVNNVNKPMTGSMYGVSGGIMTKRAPVLDKVLTLFINQMNVVPIRTVLDKVLALSLIKWMSNQLELF